MVLETDLSKKNKEFENMIDPSGRSVKKVHKDSY